MQKGAVASRQSLVEMVKQSIVSPDAPRAIGPYSSALRAGQLLFISGQVPFDPTGVMVGSDIAAQTRRVLDNIGALLKAGGLTHADVVRTTVFLADMDDFAAMNDVYRTYFSEPYPARSTVQAARLPRDARIEIDAIAMYGAERPV
jgi:2-iminobutanoate/2-iminopropanoate deaminase